jgi:antitoxin YefM
MILVMTILPLNDVKTRFSAIADEVAATHDRVIVTRNGKPHVMVISVDDFESLQMTRELLAEPGAVADVLAAEQEIAAGQFHTADELRAVLEERQRQEDERR